MIAGFSWTTFDELTLYILSLLNPKEILDIGAGEGKYGRIIRANDVFKGTEITAVEYESLRRDELLSLGYNNVKSISALDLFKESEKNYEVIILGDVIEHFRKSEGQDLLEFLNYRSAYIFIITPEAMPMSTNNFYEGHNSLWRPRDMEWHDYWLHQRCGVMHFYLLRGYQKGSGVSLKEIQQSVQQKNMFLQLGDTRGVEKQKLCQIANLTMHNTQPHDPIPGNTEMVTIYRPN